MSRLRDALNTILLDDPARKRFELLTVCLEKGMSSSEILNLTEEMEGKTDEKKELLAKKLLTNLQNKKIFQKKKNR